MTFSVINRSKHVRLAEVIDEAELRAQLDHARSIRFSKKELIWLAGNTFYGKTQMFSPDFINYLSTFRLPEYELKKVDGQYELNFYGPWTHTTMWEIPALAILNELRSRQVMKGQGRFALDVLYARAKAKLWAKVERLRKLDGLRLSDFGTRRRHGFLWQRWCVEAVKEGLGSSFTGTSNVLLAMDSDLEAIGTNAHELPMVAAALANDDNELRWAPYRILDQWRHTYGGNLLVALPDAFGTKAFLRDAPEWVADWTGFRPDSAPPIEAGEEIITWWKQKGQNPKEKLLVFSDAMDVEIDRANPSAFCRPRSYQLRLGHQPHQRFRRMRAERFGRPQSNLDRLQGHLGRWPPRRQALRQSGKGHRRGERSRALPARVRRCRPGPRRRACLTR